jgi:hypothetical protein
MDWCAGYFELRLCPLPGTTDAAEKKVFGESCFAKHPLKVKLANGRIDTKYWMYHKGGCQSTLHGLPYRGARRMRICREMPCHTATDAYTVM